MTETEEFIEIISELNTAEKQKLLEQAISLLHEADEPVQPT